MKKIIYITLILLFILVTGCSNDNVIDNNITYTNMTGIIYGINTSDFSEGELVYIGKNKFTEKYVSYNFNDSNLNSQTINLTLYQEYLDFYKEHPVDEYLPDSLFYDEFYKYDYDEHMYNQLLNYASNYSSDEEEQIDYLMHFVSSIEYKLIDDFYYPYEFLDKGYGVCNEKTLLMIGLLDRMNYSTAILVFPNNNHMAVGIECTTPQYDNYCFMDVTYGYKYLMDDDLTMSGNKSLDTTEFYVIKMTEGKKYNSDDEKILINYLYKSFEEFQNLQIKYHQIDGLLNDMDAANFESVCEDLDGVVVQGEYFYNYTNQLSIDCSDAYKLYNSKVQEINDIIHKGQDIEKELNKYPEFVVFN